MKVNDIILVSAFSNINSAKGRMYSIYSKLENSIVVTSDFNHARKHYYSKDDPVHNNQVRLHVPAYNKNLSLKRIWSHIVFANEVNRFLYSLDEKPKVVYCAMPTSLSAFICSRYCKRHGIKFIIDVIDLWPDSLLPIVKGKSILKAILYPWACLTRYAYRCADVIMGESVAYTNEAKRYNKKAKVYPIYLGTEKNIANQIKANNSITLMKPEDEIWIAYAGSLGESYDFETLISAVKAIHGRYKYKLWFIGDGIKHDSIAIQIKKYGLNAVITGFLDYEKLLGYLVYCDIAINVFRKDTKVVFSYKFNDYVVMDCFVLNSLDGETAQMVDAYHIGRNFDFYSNPLPTVLEDTCANWKKYKEWKTNCKRLVEEKLDKDKIYSVVPEIFSI